MKVKIPKFMTKIIVLIILIFVIRNTRHNSGNLSMKKQLFLIKDLRSMRLIVLKVQK